MFVKYKSFTIKSMDFAKGKMFALKIILKYFGEKRVRKKACISYIQLFESYKKFK